MTGQQASNKDIILFSKFFKDELTIDNLSRPLIVSMCKYMNINGIYFFIFHFPFFISFFRK